jgi:hypothetical protein
MTRFSPRDLSRINLCGIVINFRTITSFGIICEHFNIDKGVCQALNSSNEKIFFKPAREVGVSGGDNRFDEIASG